VLRPVFDTAALRREFEDATWNSQVAEQDRFEILSWR
jgi:hypothetical protein